MSFVSIMINLPGDVYRALIPKAARRDQQVHHLIEEAITRSVREGRPVAKPPKPPRAPRDDIDHRILELNAAGYGDNQIAKIVGRAQTGISGRRRAMGVESPTPKARPKR